eukprot:TRINITY_DN8617_c0_g1_i3.p1 TRINITY_DN8617_c0_g1~~TRINITY_DN8617_c0_g1_i3.p1  ORF type:complete len:169 (+),score=11.98 TRINITY_DN8617_c0_g1_i3:379-885(+)
MSGEDNEDMEDIRFVMDTCEVSADAARLLLSRCEWCVDEALECYFNGETTMEELELAAAKVNKGKVPACQYYWNGRCPKGDKCPLRHGEGGSQNELFTGNTDIMGYEELLDLSESMGIVPTPLHPSIAARLNTTTAERSTHKLDSCPICIETLPPKAFHLMLVHRVTL